jgi:hypothetical protein
LLQRQNNNECGTFAGGTSGADKALVFINNFFYNGKANAGAFVLGFPMQALKKGKDFINVFFFKADPVISDKYAAIPPIGCRFATYTLFFNCF